MENSLFVLAPTFKQADYYIKALGLEGQARPLVPSLNALYGLGPPTEIIVVRTDEPIIPLEIWEQLAMLEAVGVHIDYLGGKEFNV